MSLHDLAVQAAQDAMATIGETVILPGNVQVLGVLRMPTEQTSMQRGHINAPMRHPVLTLLESDSATLARGAEVTVRGETYTVTDPLPGGNGLARFPLVKTQPGDPAGQTPWR